MLWERLNAELSRPKVSHNHTSKNHKTYPHALSFSNRPNCIQQMRNVEIVSDHLCFISWLYASKKREKHFRSCVHILNQQYLLSSNFWKVICRRHLSQFLLFLWIGKGILQYCVVYRDCRERGFAFPRVSFVSKILSGNVLPCVCTYNTSCANWWKRAFFMEHNISSLYPCAVGWRRH
jgi:hypothetical protein